jgi:glycosyltransferase involved in cell wall biosynthesis
LIDSEWQSAVDIGICLLEKIKPAVVHLQHWRGLWWMLAAAQQSSIPTVYSAHDWGMACLRTILVTGKGNLCDGIVEVGKCAACIWSGRNLLGKANEALVTSHIGEILMGRIFSTQMCDSLLAKGVVRIGLRNRLKNNLGRAKIIINRLDALIVPTLFCQDFFKQFGIPDGHIHKLPWYYDAPSPPEQQFVKLRDGITLGYIGRISPEKGVHLLFEAISAVHSNMPIRLLIAGALDNQYAKALYKRYPNRFGGHSIEWLGWLPHDKIGLFFSRIDMLVIPSLWPENGPLTVLESFYHRCPVIGTDVPSLLRDLIHDGVNGFLFPYGNAQALGQVVQRIAAAPEIIPQLAKNIQTVIPSSVEYAKKLVEIYQEIS